MRTSRLPDAAFWRGRRVLLTGHTGFKGAWLAIWLHELGAEVHGFALDPPTAPNLFDDAAVARGLASDERADLRDPAGIAASTSRVRPEIVLHLAAQSLVRLSHREPLATFATNVMGTAHVLDAARRSPDVRAIVVVTSDKCYENRERLEPYHEEDALGGRDPYSASKACAEIVTGSWRASFAREADAPRIASARAGNVIGAGDMALDRLVPDCVRAFRAGKPVRLRHPGSVRPWQHVLEPLAGYLVLAETLRDASGAEAARAWNFGPDAADDATVGDVAHEAARLWGDDARIEIEEGASGPPEASILRLDSTAARASLGWAPRWPLARALEATIAGYRSAADVPLGDVLRAQIADYCAQPVGAS